MSVRRNPVQQTAECSGMKTERNGFRCYLNASYMDRDVVLRLAIARCEILYLGPILDAWYLPSTSRVTHIRLKSSVCVTCVL